jgi:murein DD-endopeptidase MepM/ murein hydrolase activator NlpD
MHMKTSLMSFKAGVSKNKEERRVIANWGDTLWSLAEDYDVSPDEIRRANNLSQDMNHLYLGQELIIPSPQHTNCMRVSRGPPLRYLLQPENIASIRALRPLVQNKIMQALLPKWQPEPFGVPCQGGWLSSLYGWKDGRWYFHNGIDIALEQGTEVIASTSGRATWSGWKGGYGKTVCLDHGNGFITLYAHCYDLLVQTGQFVRKSQVIALSGSTGHSTGPHLHFEIHKDGKTVDPLVHLPPIYHNQ